MALANVAFLAAMNGHRVLVMDWDLEAPGLSYYFKGQLDGTESRNLKDAPGVMNIVSEWSSEIQSGDNNRSNLLLERFRKGTPFEECVHSLVGAGRLPNHAALDFIGSGSPLINTPEPKPYEEVLAEFSWPSFLRDQAGGIVLHSLRQWAKLNYDFIFIDSRTGMADVAGICTMQLPDIVALCFILNRQNIDGVSRIAGAIRNGRNDEVRLHAVPMRVAREDTPEEIDARARASTELVRTGGFSLMAANDDMETLAIRLGDNVPFYETLAPFVAVNSKLDRLTLNYAAMGSRLLDQPLQVPELDSSVVELVRRRLAPRHATQEYVTKLRLMEPERAVAELVLLIENALDAALDGDTLDEGYVSAMVDASMSIADLGVSANGGAALQGRSLDLLRTLVATQKKAWKPVLINAIRRFLDVFNYVFSPEEEFALLEELDSLLAEESTISARLNRVEYRRKAAALSLQERDYEGVMQTVGEILALLSEVERTNIPLAQDQVASVLIARIDVAMLTHNVEEARDQVGKAYAGYMEVLNRLLATRQELDSTEVKIFLYRLLSKLATANNVSITDPVKAANFSIQAAQIGLPRMVMDFTALAAPVIRIEKSESALDFLNATLGSGDVSIKRLFANFFGRQAKLTIEFADNVVQLCRQISGAPQATLLSVLIPISEIFVVLINNLWRRRQTLSKAHAAQIEELSHQLLIILQQAGLDGDQLAPLAVAHESFVRNRPRPPAHQEHL